MLILSIELYKFQDAISGNKMIMQSALEIRLFDI